jgi:N-acetylglucosaminyl-diphospho-decaprenol L-rhamnosyltransferase
MNFEQVLDLDIGVVYTHERGFMTDLMKSIASAMPGLRSRMILVDNCSREGVADWQSTFPSVVLRNERQLGFAENMNRVIGASTARYLLLLNTDVYFSQQESCLTKMVEFMDQQPTCGASICRVYHPDNTYAYPARRFLTLRAVMARRLGLGNVLVNSLQRYLYLDRDPYSVFECDWISGCFMLLRQAALRQVGPLDPRFKKYFGDVDLCARLNRTGWRVMFNGATFCFHHEQRASKRVLSRDCLTHLMSYGQWMKKWGLRSPAGATPGTDLRDARHPVTATF